MAGHVGGLCQTPFRAELTAVLHASLWAVKHNRPIRIWCDCQGVVRGLGRILHGRSPKRNAPHSDLWGLLYAALEGHCDLVQIRKVVSHGAQCFSTSPIEDWVYWHNGLTDAAAEAVNFRRPDEFWQAWLGLRTALDFHRKLHRAILLVLLKTSRLASTSQRQPQVARPPAPPVVVEPVLPLQWTVTTKLVSRYGEVNLQHIHAWWQARGLTMLQGPHPLCYISGIQLFLSFNMHTGFEGPWCWKKRWYAREEEVPVPGRRQWGDRCKSFLLLLKAYWTSNGLTVPSKLTRPHSASVARWLVSYKLRWSAAMIDHVDQQVFTQLGHQATSNQDVAALHAARTG